MRQILFLGAGASVAEGYPLGRNLIRAVEDFFVNVELDVARKAYWARFLARRDTASGMEELLLRSGDPEVVLSYLDLCAEALVANDAAIRDVERTAVHDFLRMENGDDATAFATEKGQYLESLYDDLKRAPLKSAVRGRLGFVSGLDAYLGHMHWRDDQAGADSRRQHLYRELSTLDDGDVVITTNYDTLVERCYLRQDDGLPRTDTASTFH